MENSCTQHKATCYELFPHELPALDTVPSLEAELRKGAKERLASRRLEAQQKRSEKRRIVPTVRKLVHPSPPKVQKCQHSGNFVLDREVLKPEEHINFIARPKAVTPQKWPYYAMHKLSSATNRIKTLARPGTYHVKATLERLSTPLSPKEQKQKQYLQSLLEPKPFVTIKESIGYAKQQRSDDAMWRRHMAKQERKLLEKIHHWEIQILKATMETLSKRLRDFYLSPNPVPLTEEAERISRAVLRCICRFLDTTISNQKGHDVIDDFYVEFSQKVGYWVWKMMEQTGLTFDKQKSFSYVRKSESFVSVNSSVFELPVNGDDVVIDSKLELLSILSLELVYDCLDAAVLTVEKGISERRNSVCIERKDEKNAEQEEALTLELDEDRKQSTFNADTHAVTDDNIPIEEHTLEDLDDDQVTVIENIPNDETDEENAEPVENKQKEEKPEIA